MSVDEDKTAQMTDEGQQNGHDHQSHDHDQGHGGWGAMDDNVDLPDMSEMARLLDEQEAQFRSIKRGDVVEGQIVRIDPEEILVDIGLKSEGVLSTKELPSAGYGSLAELNVGDNVLVYVMQPETPEGHAIVSIKRARLERQWRIAQEQYERGDLLEAEVIDHNKGGLIVNLEGIRGFVPISQILNLKREDTADNAETQQKLASMVGRRLQLKIIEINRNRNRLILSERLAVQEWRAKRREELLNELQVGEVRKGIVSNLSNFGAFVDLGGADGLVHISQLAWSRVNHPSEVLKVGQDVEVQVLSVDKEKKKIALSIKRAEVDPWTTVESRYTVGQLVKGTITKIAPFGAFARIEDGIEGLIHLSELPPGQQDPKAVLKEGQEVTVRILRIDPDRRRLGLSIRQAEEGAYGEPEGEVAVEPEGRAPAGMASAEEPAEAHADVSAPAAEQRTPAPAPAAPAARRQEEPPTTAMAAAFQAAMREQQREQPTASAAETETAAPAAEAASAEAAAPAAAAPAAEAAEPATAEAAPAAEVSVAAAAAMEAPPAESPVSQEPASATPVTDEPLAATVAPAAADAVNGAEEAATEAIKPATSTSGKTARGKSAGDAATTEPATEPSAQAEPPTTEEASAAEEAPQTGE